MVFTVFVAVSLVASLSKWRMDHMISYNPYIVLFTDESTPSNSPPVNYRVSARGEDVPMNVNGQADYGVQALVVVDYALYEKYGQ